MKIVQSIAVLAASLSLSDALTLNKRSNPRVVRATTQRKSNYSPLDHDRRRYSLSNNIQKRQDDTVSVTLENEITLYFINVTIGTPAQSFALHIDTGSSDLWVNTPDSRLCQRYSQYCRETGVYTQSASDTANTINNDFNITYADGSTASGTYVTDVLGIDSDNLQNFQFGVASESNSPEGILGVGYVTNEAAAAEGRSALYPNLPAAMADAGLINTNAYSLWLNDLDASSGAILFGGVNTAKFSGELTTLPIIPTYGYYSQFLVGMSGVGLNGDAGSVASDLNLAVLLDSGTSLTYLPNDIVSSIYDYFQTSYNDEAGAAPVSCSLAQQTGSIDFSFSSLTISVNLSEIVINLSTSSFAEACVLGIAPVGNNPYGILGDTFLRSAYVVYDLDNNEISLAQTDFSVADDSNNVLEISSGTDGVPSATPEVSPITSVNAVATGPIGNYGDVSRTGNAAAVQTPPPVWRAGSGLAAGAAAAAVLAAF